MLDQVKIHSIICVVHAEIVHGSEGSPLVEGG